MTTITTDQTTLVVTTQNTQVIINPDVAQSTVVTSAIGPQGLSAYLVAVENGFVGSEQDWLDSITGNTQDLVLTKGVDELATITVNFANRLASGQTISGVTSVVASPGTAAITNISFTPTLVIFKISGGVLHQGFRVDISVTTSNPSGSLSGTVYLLNI